MKIHIRNVTKTNQAALVGCLLFLSFAIFPFLDLKGSVEEAEKKSAALLQEYQNQDVATISKNIRNQQKMLLMEEAKTEQEKIQLAFQGSVVIGDSIAAALSEYSILSSEFIFAKRGLRSDNCDTLLHEALETSPDVIFLELGMNDLEYWGGSAERFIEQYTNIIETIKTTLPETQIYINAILPIDDSAIQRVPVYRDYTTFNEALAILCEKYNLTFIDNAALLQEMDQRYEFDGVHPKYDFYPKWAQNMALIAGFMQGDAS